MILNRFAERIKIIPKTVKKGIGKMIGYMFSPCEFRIDIPRMDNVKGIISLIMPIARNRVLLYFPVSSRKTSNRKKSLKKQNSK